MLRLTEADFKQCDPVIEGLGVWGVSSQEPSTRIDRAAMCVEADDAAAWTYEVVDETTLADPFHNLQTISINFFDTPQFVWRN
jgi:hypothetical protein